jgi:rhodanese-related sulfurtransferase
MSAVRLGLRRTSGSSRCSSWSTPSSARWSGWSAASCPDRRAGVPPRGEDRGAVVHRGVRRDQGAHELPRRALVRSLRSQARARRRLARRGAGAVPADVGAELVVGALRQRAARREPGPHLVDHGHHEDRPRGPAKRGLAMGLNEFAGYFAVAGSALATGSSPRATACARAVLPRRRLRRDRPRAVAVSRCARRSTTSRPSRSCTARARRGPTHPARGLLAHHAARSNLSSVSQAGLVNNLNDGMAWGLFPLFFAAAGMDLGQIGTLAAIYPATWGVAQLFTGAWSDRVGRKWLIAAGMWVQAWASGWWSSPRLRGLRDRRGAARRRHGDGLPDAARGHRRRGPPVVARLVGGRVPPLARPRLRDRRAARGPRRRRARPARRRCGLVAALTFASGIPLDRLEHDARQLAFDRPVVTICGKGGGRSAEAAQRLRALGFITARSLCGGTAGWQARGVRAGATT